MNNELSITFCGGARKVTGSNFLVSNQHTSFIVDCGLFQGDPGDATRNQAEFPYDPSRLLALFVTHAHLDHIGRIPLLIKAGFKGVIYSTPATRDMAELVFADGVRIADHEARQKGTLPLYTKDDVAKAFEFWKTVSYHEIINLTDEFRITLLDSGHILGSAMIDITYKEKRIVFTGDLGNSPSPLLNDTESIAGADYLITESVYGNRNHENVEARSRIFEEVIEDTIKRKGVLMIPAFSIERTQDLLFELDQLVTGKKIPDVPVFLDSPLAIGITEVYKKYRAQFNDRAKQIIKHDGTLFDFPRLKITKDAEESIAINNAPEPKIIIAGSGMSEGGRITHHEKRYLSDPHNTLLLVGYQAAGTLGRALADGAKEVFVDHEKIAVRAQILKLQGYSAHRDSTGLMSFIETAADSLKEVFVVLGEPEAAFFLAQRVQDYLGIKAVVPGEGDTIRLQFD
jgi:metallo-beta-lactamase family protein